MNTSKKHKRYQLTPKEVPISNVLTFLGKNELGDADFFAEVFADQVCYDHSDGKWYLWNGHHWKQDETARVRLLVSGVLSSLYLKAAAILNTTHVEMGIQLQALQGSQDSNEAEALSKRYKALTNQINGLQARAKDLQGAKRMNSVSLFIQARMGITSSVWDTDPWLLAVPNGVIDLHTGECRKGAADDYIRTVSPTEWTGLDTPCPRFERFLQEIFEDKPDRDALIDFLQRLLGYGITGVTTTHIFPILYGLQGRNGKDTLLSILKAVLGPLVGAVSNDVFLVRDKNRTEGAATPHLVDLQGKRLAWGSEPKEGDRLNIAQIKLLTGAGEVSTRQIHGHQYSFTPTHKLLLMTNYKPHADARDDAFWPRACLIEFNMRFLEEPKAPNERHADLNLRDALQREQSGILAWLVRGCLAWQQQGLSIPPSIKLATDRYRQEEDKLLLFLQECCVTLPEASVKGQPLYDAYRKWSEDNQMGRCINGREFGKEMKKRFEWGELRGRITYRGIGLLAREDDPQPLALFEETGTTPTSGDSGATVKKVLSPRPDAPLEASLDIHGDSGDSETSLSKVNPEARYRENRGSLSPLSPLPSVNISQSAPEDEPQKEDGTKVLPPHPRPEGDTHPCTTRYEKWRQVAHKAIAMCLSAGCWWCERCEPQRIWMEVGEAKNYPQVDVPAHRFKVKQGRENWLQFAQEAGYPLVQKALEAVQPPREKEEL